MANVGFLHTADVHVATFDALARERGLSTEHQVKSEWLTWAIESGITPALRSQVVTSLDALLQACDVVICTCTTLGSIAAEHKDPRVFRVDGPLMQQASQHSGIVLLAYALESTRASSLSLLEAAGTVTDNIQLLDCTADWTHFENNHIEEFGRAIAERIKQNASENNLSCVVLAQASMASAQNHLGNLAVPVYSSPATAMDYAARTVQGD